MASEIVFLPDRLNRQPVVFLGLTDGELRLVGLVNIVVWVPVGSLLGALVGAATLGLGAGALVAVGGIWASGKALRRLKRGKPAGYHTDRIGAWLQERGIGPRRMLRSSEVWDIRAHAPRGRGRRP